MRRTTACACACLALVLVGCRPGLGDLSGGRERNTSHALTHAGVDRRFHLHVPPGYGGDARWPLVLALHGGGGRGLGFDGSATDGTLLAEADRLGFVVAFPDGVDRAWNDGRRAAAVAERTHDDVGFLATLIDTLVATHRIDRQRVFATGISNGGMMSFRLACELSGRVAAVAPVAANMPAALAGCAPARPVSVLLVNGTADPLVPYDGGPITVGLFGTPKRDRGVVSSSDASVAFWVARNRCPRPPVREMLPDVDPEDETRVAVERYDGCQAGTAVALYRVEGGGHTWPGGRQYLPERWVGRVSRDLEASRAILEFFAALPRSP